MKAKTFLEMNLSRKDTVTVNAVELQNVIRENNYLTNKVSELDSLNDSLSEANSKLVKKIKIIEKNIKDNSDNYSKLAALEVSYNRLESNYNKLVEKLELSNAISESRKQRLHCEELTKGLHVDLRS